MLIDIAAVLITALIAWHGLTFRTEDGEPETGHMIFGAIALLFCLRFLFVDLLGVVKL
jgi:hypothetical protein